MDVLEEYERGVDCYWAGGIPTGWANAAWGMPEVNDKIANVPFLCGWYHASLADNGVI